MFPRCSRCQIRLQYQEIRYRSSFSCPKCGALLHIPATYTVGRAYFVLLICVLSLFLLGLRAYALAIIAVAGWPAALFLDAKLGRVLFPPMIRVEEDIDSRMTRLRL